MQLHQRHQELSTYGVQILLICFGPKYWAQVWREQMNVPFPLLLDLERDVYQDYGLKQSFWGSFGLRATWYYLRHFKLPNIKGNPTQLGGDFIVDGAGRLCYEHRSRDAADRPTVHELITVLKQSN